MTVFTCYDFVYSHFTDIAERCLSDRLTAFYFSAEEFNANIKHIPLRDGEKPYIPYTGNGVFGIETNPESPLIIRRDGRTLSLPVRFHPVVSVTSSIGAGKPLEATVVHYLNGLVHKFQCYDSGLYVTYQYYAHRTLPAIFVQDIKISNPTNENFSMDLRQIKVTKWPTVVSQTTT